MRGHRGGHHVQSDRRSASIGDVVLPCRGDGERRESRLRGRVGLPVPCVDADAGSAVTTFETVLAWLGSTGMSVRACSNGPFVEVSGNEPYGDRIASVFISAEGSSRFFTHTYVRPVGKNGFTEGPLERSSWDVHGEAGVRYLAHWLRDGGSVKSPYVVARKES